MKGNITWSPAHNGRLLTNSHLILPLYSPFHSFRERYQDYGDMVRKKREWNTFCMEYILFGNEKKRTKIKQACTCSLEKCFN